MKRPKKMDYKRLDAHLSTLGYCTRSEAKSFLKSFCVAIGGVRQFDPKTKAHHKEITIDNEPLDPINLTILMNKPTGFICSHNDAGVLIYSILPPRWQRRNPKISTIGRLDSDTTGAIVLSDDGALNHKLSSPNKLIPKIYEVWLESPLKGDEKDLFASGSLMLHQETKPLKPAKMEILSPHHVLLEIYEGKYHQVKRMFGAVGNKVIKLHRKSFGGYNVDDLAFGEYKILTHIQM